MNIIEGYRTKIKPIRCKDAYVNKPTTKKDINWIMDCPVEHYAKKYNKEREVKKC